MTTSGSAWSLLEKPVTAVILVAPAGQRHMNRSRGGRTTGYAPPVSRGDFRKTGYAPPVLVVSGRRPAPGFGGLTCTYPIGVTTITAVTGFSGMGLRLAMPRHLRQPRPRNQLPRLRPAV